MGDKISEIKHWLDDNKNTATVEELIVKEKQIIQEYNKIISPYRKLLRDISESISKKNKEKIQNCNHKYTRYCEYHNESYKICDLCGHEV